MSDLDLEAIKARCAAATPGEWRWMCVSLPGIGRGPFDVAWLLHDGRTNDDGYAAGAVVLRHQAATWVPVRSDRDFLAHARTDVPALVAEVERLRSDLAECYRITGADPDGDDDAMLAQKAVAAVKRLREESDTEAETADKRIAELEAAVSDAMVVIADMAPGETVLIDRLRSLLAKGGAA